MEAPCLILSHRPWHSELAKRLEALTHRPFFLFNDPQKLSKEAVEEIKPRYIFVPHWSHLIPESIFGAFECIIFHMTDLPFGRGGSPLQNLIAQGVEKTKMSAIRCVRELDAGPIYCKKDLDLSGSAQDIFLRSTALIETMIVEILNQAPDPVPQAGNPTYFTRRRPEDGDLSKLSTVKEVYDYIRMLDCEGYPPAFLESGPFRFEFSHAQEGDGVVSGKVTIRLNR